MRQCCYSIVVLFNQVLTLTTEEERFLMIWSHVLDLLRNGYHRLVLLHLKLAHAQICEAGDFQGVELGHSVLKFFSIGIFAQEVVIDVAKVKVSIHFLVNFGGLSMVLSLEKLSCGAFESHQHGILVSYWNLIKVRCVFDAKEGDCKLDCIAIIKRLVLVKEWACEVCAELIDSRCRQSNDHVLLHGLEELLEQTGKDVVVQLNAYECGILYMLSSLL